MESHDRLCSEETRYLEEVLFLFYFRNTFFIFNILFLYRIRRLSVQEQVKCLNLKCRFSKQTGFPFLKDYLITVFQTTFYSIFHNRIQSNYLYWSPFLRMISTSIVSKSEINKISKKIFFFNISWNSPYLNQVKCQHLQSWFSKHTGKDIFV